MSEILEVYQNEPAYGLASWDSDWINVSSSKTLTFTAFSDQNYDIGIRYAVNETGVVIDTDVVSVLANNAYTFHVPVQNRFAQFFILNIAANPCILRTQGFFYE
jgi:hypothetical protein